MSRELNERIRAEMQRRELTERGASKRSGLSYGTLHYVLEDDSHNPEPEPCRKLASFFGWDEDWVLEVAGHRSPRAIREAPVPYTELLRRAEEEAPIPVPIYEQIAHAGGGGGVPMGYTYVDASYGRSRRLVAIYVHGNCMEPNIPDGAVIVVDLDKSPREGQIVVVTLNQTDTMVRRLRSRTNHSLVLSCDNPAYASIEVEDVHVDGVVIWYGKQVE